MAVSDLLQRLSQQRPTLVSSFHPHIISGSQHVPASFAGEKKDTADSKIVIMYTRPLAEKSLLNYLQKRCIPVEIAST